MTRRLTMTQEKPYEYKELGATIQHASRELQWTKERTQFTYELYKELLYQDTNGWMRDPEHENKMGEPSIWMTNATWKKITEKENAIWNASQPKPSTTRPHMGRGFSFDDFD
jgi:hypothetical protein